MSLRVTLRDTIRFSEDQPEALVIGDYEAIRFDGMAMFGDEKLIARHEEGLGWAVADRSGRDEDDPYSFIYSDMSIEQVGDSTDYQTGWRQSGAIALLDVE